MPKKAAVLLIAILAALAFLIGVAFAAANMVTGEVVLASPSAKTLVISVQGEEMTSRAAEKAAMLVGHLFTDFLEEQEMTFSVAENVVNALAHLKPGDKVTVSYTENNGKLYAQSVTKD